MIVLDNNALEYVLRQSKGIIKGIDTISGNLIIIKKRDPLMVVGIETEEHRDYRIISNIQEGIQFFSEYRVGEIIWLK